MKRRDVRSRRHAAIDWYGTNVQGSTGGSLGSGIDIANRGQIRFYRKTPTACSVKLTISYEVGHSPPENVQETKMHRGFPKSPSVHRQLVFCICEDGRLMPFGGPQYIPIVEDCQCCLGLSFSLLTVAGASAAQTFYQCCSVHATQVPDVLAPFAGALTPIVESILSTDLKRFADLAVRQA